MRSASSGSRAPARRGLHSRPVRPELLSESIQDYLKEIYKLASEGERPTTSAIARQMCVSAPSVTSMLKKLAALGLVVHEPYRGAALTEAEIGRAHV